ncbi:MAG: DUF2905 domain-containing protein [Candidatus Limnocylindria bacterium]
MDVSAVGRLLVVIGVVTVVVGLLLTLGGRVPFLGRLPGDFEVRGDGWTLYAPVATMIVLSVAITLVLALLGWLGGRR